MRMVLVPVLCMTSMSSVVFADELAPAPAPASASALDPVEAKPAATPASAPPPSLTSGPGQVTVAAAAPGFRSPRRGLTIEAALGTGWSAGEKYNGVGAFSSLLGGGSLGLGGWLSPRLALTARAVLSVGEDDEADVTNAFVGFGLQYWFDDHGWVGAGAGPALAVFESRDAEFGIAQAGLGTGLDLRAGYAIPLDNHAAFHISLEATPWYIEETWSTTLALMAGLQML